MISAAARTRRGLPFLILMATSLAAAGCRQSPTPAATRHNDARRTGAYLDERILTPGNVNELGMRKRTWRPLDGTSLGQVLCVPNVTINGEQHNVVYLLTTANTIHAYDADDPDKPGTTQGRLWITRLPPVKDATRPNPLRSWARGTPVIDVPTVVADDSVMPGGNLSLSADGTRDGILWATQPHRKGDKGHLIAFDALSLRELWRIAMPLPAHFVPPTIADGKVFVVTEHATLQIYDLPE